MSSHTSRNVDVQLYYSFPLRPLAVAWQSVKLESANFGGAENARSENDGQRTLWVWKTQDWKMTDKLLANSEHNYGVSRYFRI